MGRVLQVIKTFQFDWRYMLRGLTIDKKRGNILKIDRHKYVKLAHHGFEPLTHEQRLSSYNAAEVSSTVFPVAAVKTDLEGVLPTERY